MCSSDLAPWGWGALRQSPQGRRILLFLAIWFLPPFLLSVVFHGAAPGHTLAGQVPLALFGAVCLCAFEAAVKQRWQPHWPLGAALSFSVLICAQLFFSNYLPVNGPVEPRSRWAQLLKPVRYGLYETSYQHVRWVDGITDEAFQQMRERIAAYKCPKTFEVRPAPLPRNAAGKILKTELRSNYAAQAGAKAV